MSSPFADRDGAYAFELAGHRYTGHLLDADEGFALAIRLSSALVDPICAIVGPPLLKALGSPALISSFQSAAAGGDGDFVEAFLGADASALAEAAGAIDPGQVAGGIQQVLQALDLPTVRAILARTYRDGQPLSELSHFNAAFRGNYVEAFKAAAKVARGNGFLPDLATIVSSISAAAPRMGAGATSGSGESAASSTTRPARA